MPGNAQSTYLTLFLHTSRFSYIPHAFRNADGPSLWEEPGRALRANVSPTLTPSMFDVMATGVRSRSLHIIINSGGEIPFPVDETRALSKRACATRSDIRKPGTAVAAVD